MKYRIPKIKICISVVYSFFCITSATAQVSELKYSYSNYPSELFRIQNLPETNEIYLYSCKKFIELGDSLYDNNRKQEAGIMFEKSIPYILLYRPELAAELYLRIGNTCSNRSKATEYFMTGLAYAPSTRQGINTKAKLLTNIARTLIGNGDYGKAHSYLDSSISVFLTQKDSLNGAISLMHKGNIYNIALEREKAKENYVHAIQLLSNNDNENFIRLQSRITYNLSGLYLDENQPDSAIVYLSLILPLFGKLSHEERLIHYYLTGCAYLYQKKYAKAEYYLQHSLRSAEAKNYRDIILYSSKALAQLYEKQGNFQKAWHYGSLHFTMQTDIFEQTKSDINKVNQLEFDFTLAKKDKALAENKLLIAQQEKNLAQKNFWLLSTISGSSIVIILAFGMVRSYQRKQNLLQKEQEIIALKALIEGEEKERQRLSRELHDGIGGMLAAVKYKVGSIRKQAKEDDVYTQLNDVMEMLQDTSSEVRTTAHNLLPDMLNRYPLKEALNAYIGKLRMGSQVNIELQAPEQLSILSKTVELIIFRMIQELVNNATRHASANHIDIQLMEYEDQLTLLIEDDGKGFDPAKKTGYGLENLKYRVHSLQGAIDIDSAPGKGTAIRITFNLDRLKETTL